MPMRLLIIMLILVPGLARAESVQQRNALVLYSYHDTLPWQNGIRTGIQERLDIYPASSTLQLFEENLDSIRLVDQSTIEDWVQFLKTKYRNTDFDMVIAESESTVGVLSKHPELFSNAKKYFINPGTDRFELDYSNAIFVDEDVNQALQTTIDMRPDAKKILVIGNLAHAPIDNLRDAWTRNHRHQVEFEVWSEGFTFNELYRRVAGLPDDVVIFYALVNHDSSGIKMTPYSVLQQLAKSSSVPVFVMHDTLLGSGAVGGHVLSAQKVGWAIADLLMGAEPSNFTPAFFSEYMFDARALERWRIPASDVPGNSTLLYQETSVWEEYRFEIIIALLIASIETLILLALVQALRAKRLAMTRLSRAHSQMENHVEERTAQLREANAALEKANIRDELTQIANRRHFDDVLDTEFRRLTRSGAPLSLIILDLDFFKSLNDSLGHVAGDECLARVALTISRTVGRVTDLVARYGGEEFAIILPETGFDGAFSLAEQIRQSIIDAKIANPASTVANCVSASLGVVTIAPSSIDAVKDVIELADEQLYIAKDNGRNRVDGKDYSSVTDIKVKRVAKLSKLN